MFKVGLTGAIASGKSTVSQLFSDVNIPIIDADMIARTLVEPGQDGYHEILQAFGQSVLLDNGSLNRPKLRQLIFSDPLAKQQLEHIMHPKIRQQLIAQSHNSIAPYYILSIPLLIEAEMTDIVDRILVIDIDLQLQIKRLCERDHMSLDAAKKMINGQCSRQQRLILADDIIVNNSSITALKEQVSQLHHLYQKLAKLSANGCQHGDSHGE